MSGTELNWKVNCITSETLFESKSFSEVKMETEPIYKTKFKLTEKNLLNKETPQRCLLVVY